MPQRPSEEKRQIDRPSSPRWEIDIVAYRAPENHVLAIECKSFMDSTGVVLSDLQGGKYARTYKLFNEPTLRKVVFNRLRKQLVKESFCAKSPRVTLALAAGKIKGGDTELLRKFFNKQKWQLFDAEWIRKHLEATAEKGYSNSVAAMVVKLIGVKRTNSVD